MAVTPAMIAVALGVAAPATGSAQEQQWSMWISDALRLIEARRAEVNPALELDPAMLDYVVREAVAALASTALNRRADGAKQVAVTSDDTSVSKTFDTSLGRVSILDEWWKLLGLSGGKATAFSFTPARTTRSAHLPWCNLAFGATYCSCGADIAGYPIFEGGPEW